MEDIGVSGRLRAGDGDRQLAPVVVQRRNARTDEVGAFDRAAARGEGQEGGPLEADGDQALGGGGVLIIRMRRRRDAQPSYACELGRNAAARARRADRLRGDAFSRESRELEPLW